MNKEPKQIVDARIDGNWIEFWFNEGGRDSRKYDESCKAYMFQNAIQDVELSEHTWLHGIIGLWVVWPSEYDRPIAISTTKELK